MQRQIIQRGTCPPVLLDYTDGNGDPSSRIVAPIAIILTGKRRTAATGIYLHARCTVARQIRAFRFDRIGSIGDTETGEVVQPMAWLASLVLGETKPFSWAAEESAALDDPPSSSAPVMPQALEAPPSSRRMLHLLRSIVIAMLIGYMLGRFRIISHVVRYFGGHHGLWL